MLRAVQNAYLNGSEILVRMEGRDYYYDFKLSSTDLYAIDLTLTTYDNMIGSGEYQKW